MLRHCLIALALLLAPLALSAPRIWYGGQSAELWETLSSYENYLHTYTHQRITYDRDAQAMEWRFQRKPSANDAPYAEGILYTRYRLEPAQLVTVRVRNLGNDDVHLGCAFFSYGEAGPGYNASCRRYATDGHPLPADGAWHDLTFHFAPDQPLEREASALEFIVSQIPATADVRLQCQRITLDHNTLPEARLTEPLVLPPELHAGNEFTLAERTVVFPFRRPLDQRAWLEFIPRNPDQLPGQPAFRIALQWHHNTTPNTWTIPAQTLRLPHCLFTGPFAVRLHCGEGGTARAGAAEIKIIGREKVAFTSAEVKPWHGAPTIHLNGTPEPGVMKATFTHGTENLGVKAFTQAGVRLFSFDATPSANTTFLHCNTCEVAPGVFDYRQFDDRVMDYLNANPNAFLLPRLYFAAPAWWQAEHPDDLVQVEDLDGTRRSIAFCRGHCAPSLASESWRKYTENALRHLVEHIAQTPYADRIIGFNLGAGSTQEWEIYGSSDNLWPDYSPAARDDFREWLRKKYHTDLQLQNAWLDHSATLDDAEPPTAAERSYRPDTEPDLRNPNSPVDRKCVDYCQWTAESTAETIARFAHVVKNASQGKLLAGAFYGYVFDLSGGQRLLNSGHLALARLLANPDLDFFCAPTGYCFRETGGEGTCYQMTATASLTLHQKLWFVEMDVRTSDTPVPEGLAGKPKDLAGDLLQQNKEAAHTLCNGLAQWWFDVGQIHYDNPQLLEHLAKLTDLIQNATLHADRTPVAQVAYVIDQTSLLWARCPSDVPVDYTAYQLPFVTRLGTPVECYLADDLDQLPERIRFVILATSLAPSPKQLSALRKLQADDRVILFFHAPGVIPPNPKTTPAHAMQDFTTLPLDLANSATSDPVVDAPDGDWLPESTRGKRLEPIFWGPRKKPMLPRPYIREDERTRILARYPDGLGALATYQGDHWTGLYSASPNPPRELLLAALRHAGVHRYLDTPDQVWATAGMVAICVKEPGPRTIHLGQPNIVLQDPLANESFTTDANGDFTAEFQARATRLFLLNPAD